MKKYARCIFLKFTKGIIMRVLILIMLTFNLVSCYYSEHYCDSSNAEDLPGFAGKKTAQEFSGPPDSTTGITIPIVINRLGKGIYQSNEIDKEKNGNYIINTCRLTGIGSDDEIYAEITKNEEKIYLFQVTINEHGVYGFNLINYVKKWLSDNGIKYDSSNDLYNGNSSIDKIYNNGVPFRRLVNSGTFGHHNTEAYLIYPR